MRDLGGEWKGRKNNPWLGPGRFTCTKKEINLSIGFDNYLYAILTINVELSPYF